MKNDKVDIESLDFLENLATVLMDEYTAEKLAADAYHETLFKIIDKIADRGQLQRAIRLVGYLDVSYVCSEKFITLAGKDSLILDALKGAAKHFPISVFTIERDVDVMGIKQKNGGLLS